MSVQIFVIIATSLLYLSPCLGPYSILVTAGSGGVYIYSCCSYCSYYRVAGAAIKVASNAAIGTTYSTAVKIASGISGHSYKHCCKYYCKYYGCCCKAYYKGSYCGGFY